MNNNLNERKYFMTFCILSIVLVGIIFGLNSIMRGTNASFGGITGELTVTYKVTYHSNWPNENMENISNEYNGKKMYQILNNMFEVPTGYEFLGWGTEPNGVVVYSEGHVMNLSSELNLYAIWGMSDSEEDNNDDNTEETIIAYGDTNLDGIVNENDYLLIDNYLIDNSILTGQGLTNADVNIDGKVDNIDSDIIKQACLSTEGYVGFLPEKPVLIYELYVEDESTEKEDTSDDNTGGGNTSSGNGSASSGTGSGGGTTGSGNSNSGSGSGGNKPNGSTNIKPNVNNANGNNKEETEKPKDELPKVYEFKFINGNIEYAITKCDILNDGTCKLILPNTIPSKTGFVFKGWSLDEDCSKHIIKESMDVNSGGTYYACYTEIIQKKQEKNTTNTWIIVVTIWFLASTLIYRIIKQYKNGKENN